MTNITIENTVIKACEGKCMLDFYKSSISNSLYFHISNEFSDYYFRISDHPTKTKIKSFTVSKNTKSKAIFRFVTNCIRRMKTREYYNKFDLISKSLKVADSTNVSIVC